MKARLLLFSLGLTALAHGGTPEVAAPSPEVEKKPFSLPGEFDSSYSFVGGPEVRRNGRSTSFTENEFQTHLIFTPKTGPGYLRLGVEWERYSFSLANRSPLPNTLQSLNLVVGLDTSLGESFLIRAEAQPGFYGTFTDHLSQREFNVPFVIGGTYLQSGELQFIAGVSVDLHRKYPVIPAVGLRWNFASGLVLNAVLPTPRLEYEYSKALTLYVGAELRDETYRVDGQFGDFHGNEHRLDHALLTYSEIRVGAGFQHKVTSGSHPLRGRRRAAVPGIRVRPRRCALPQRRPRPLRPGVAPRRLLAPPPPQRRNSAYG